MSPSRRGGDRLQRCGGLGDQTSFEAREQNPNFVPQPGVLRLRGMVPAWVLGSDTLGLKCRPPLRLSEPREPTRGWGS